MKMTQKQFDALEKWVHAVAEAAVTNAMTDWSSKEKWECREFAEEVAAAFDAENALVGGNT